MNTHKLKEKCSFLYNHSMPLGHYITSYPLIVASHFLFPVFFWFSYSIHQKASFAKIHFAKIQSNGEGCRATYSWNRTTWYLDRSWVSLNSSQVETILKKERTNIKKRRNKQTLFCGCPVGSCVVPSCTLARHLWTTGLAWVFRSPFQKVLHNTEDLKLWEAYLGVSLSKEYVYERVWF